jgi:hypothetical protein
MRWIVAVFLISVLIGQAHADWNIDLPPGEMTGSKSIHAKLPGPQPEAFPTKYNETYLVQGSIVVLFEGGGTVEAWPSEMTVYEAVNEGGAFNSSMLGAALLERMSFQNGAPAVESVTRAGLIKLANMGDYVRDHRSGTFAGYDTVIYSIINPMSGKPGYMAQIKISDKEIIHVLADELAFSAINNTLEIGD